MYVYFFHTSTTYFSCISFLTHTSKQYARNNSFHTGDLGKYPYFCTFHIPNHIQLWRRYRRKFESAAHNDRHLAFLVILSDQGCQLNTHRVYQIRGWDAAGPSLIHCRPPIYAPSFSVLFDISWWAIGGPLSCLKTRFHTQQLIFESIHM